MMKKRLQADHGSGTAPDTVLVAGGTLGSWAHPYLASGALLVGADRGALYIIESGFTPDAALGDFDSVSPEEKRLIEARSRLFLDCDPVRKDLTDTEWAFDWALSQNPASLILLGATGTRFDHTFANVQLLVKAAEQGIPCRIIDGHNEICLLAEEDCVDLIKGDYGQVSLLPLSGTVSGITLEGFMYPLLDAEIRVGQSLGISNVIVGETATVRIRQGKLLVIQSRD